MYLTQQLDGVYTDTDPRSYQLSSYSYLILPTKVGGQFNEAKGRTLGAFAYYAMCQAQQQSASLGYSPMPINLVQASFDQIRKIPGVEVQNIDIADVQEPDVLDRRHEPARRERSATAGVRQAGHACQCADGHRWREVHPDGRRRPTGAASPHEPGAGRRSRRGAERRQRTMPPCARRTAAPTDDTVVRPRHRGSAPRRSGDPTRRCTGGPAAVHGRAGPADGARRVPPAGRRSQTARRAGRRAHAGPRARPRARRGVTSPSKEPE